jgi:hypothetical protein
MAAMAAASAAPASRKVVSVMSMARLYELRFLHYYIAIVLEQPAAAFRPTRR